MYPLETLPQEAGPNAARCQVTPERELEPRTPDGDFRASRFACREGQNGLAQWFPLVQEDETSSRWRIWSSRRSRALLIQITIICVIFVSNLVLTILAVSKYRSQDGVGLIYEGDCTTVRDLNLWIHLLINLLSTGMLSASNFCMQLQAAPTRANVNRAHDGNDWMDIGVPSLRNLKYISRWRRLAWALLALSSLPIHFL